MLDNQQPRDDFACAADIDRPVLSFDQKLDTGYDVAIPLRELAGVSPTSLTVVFRVTPENGSGEPALFSQHFKAPTVENNAEGDAQLHGDNVMRQRVQLPRTLWPLKTVPPSRTTHSCRSSCGDPKSLVVEVRQIDAFCG